MRSRRTWRNRIAQARWVLLASVFPAVLAFETTAADLECRGKDISGATSCWSKSSSAALMRMKDCTGNRTRVQLEDWLHSVRAVAVGYNRK